MTLKNFDQRKSSCKRKVYLILRKDFQKSFFCAIFQTVSFINKLLKLSLKNSHVIKIHPYHLKLINITISNFIKIPILNNNN